MRAMSFLAGSLGVTVPTEAMLVRLAKDGDPTVWAAWHEEYYSLLHRYANAWLRDASEAEDIVADVFLAAIEGIHRYDYRGQPVRSWFYGIARNLVNRRYHQRNRRAQLSSDDSLAAPRFESDLDDKVILEAALDGLKEEHREVLILRFLLDLPMKEVARLIGKSDQATNSLQTRALEAMKRVLQKSEIPALRPKDPVPLAACTGRRQQ